MEKEAKKLLHSRRVLSTLAALLVFGCEVAVNNGYIDMVTAHDILQTVSGVAVAFYALISKDPLDFRLPTVRTWRNERRKTEEV